jgi:lipopolysaccharide export system ATP-binding protein
VLITDHNVRRRLRITDRAYIMYEGRILLQGPPRAGERPEAREIYLGERFSL